MLEYESKMISALAINKADLARKRISTWIEWAEHHPGLLLFGTILVAALFFTPTTDQPRLEVDPGGEEVPLFI